MKTIPLSKGKTALVSDEDFKYLSRFKWYAGHTNPWQWYAYRNAWVAGRKTMLTMHRHIMGSPRGMDVDHRDGDGLNNTRENLRICTRSENLQNRKLNANNTSGYRGVLKYKNRWLVQMTIAGKRRRLGLFATAEEAAQAYNEAARRHYGQFARLNIITIGGDQP